MSTMTALAAERPIDAQDSEAARIADLWRRTRAHTVSLVDGLPPEDLVVQSMEDASPAKWHLAHTTWFFETFVLGPYVPGYESPDPRFAYLFNSYYVQAGPRFSRAQRGLVTRPTVAEVLAYRRTVDAFLQRQIERGTLPPAAMARIELGCHHEMQHQELLLTDLLHAFSFNPLRPAWRAPEPPVERLDGLPGGWTCFDGGIVEIGHRRGSGFAFDNEGPRHEVLLRPFKLANRLVTNREWLAFIDEGGYRRPELWLSDGYATVQREGWEAPLYWWQEGGLWWSMTLRGAAPIELEAPVTHISFYEADAYARFCGKRLPTEAEWEQAAAGRPVSGNFTDSGHYRPQPCDPDAPGLLQLFGDVWEWTASAYLGYPGFAPEPGAVGEYNGKFMCNQFVLRGGSCATQPDQLRATYRNFFYPHQRWQFTGLRLAMDDV